MDESSSMLELCLMSEMFDSSGLEFVHLEHVSFTPEFLNRIPARIAHQFQILPIDIYPRGLKIVISAPCTHDTLDTLCSELCNEMPRELQICIADATQLRQFINKLYPL